MQIADTGTVCKGCMFSWLQRLSLRVLLLLEACFEFEKSAFATLNDVWIR